MGIGTEELIAGVDVIELELVEQVRLLSMLSPIMAESSCAHISTRNHCPASHSKPF
jgi:hypothetical protein